MANLSVVLLLVVAACIHDSQGQFFQQSAAGYSGNPFAGAGGNPFTQGQYEIPQLLTCIGRNEALDQIRITIRPEPRYGHHSPAFSYGRMKELEKMDWRISALYIPATSQNIVSPAGTSSLVGSFFLAVTRYGRTSGSCAGLGGILQEDDVIPDRGSPHSGFGSSLNPILNNPYLRARYGLSIGGIGGHPLAGGFGGLSSLGHFGGLGGLGGLYGHPRPPPGYIQDPIVVSPGGNVYSGVIRNLAEIDLRGRGLAICLDNACQRSTTTCCSIVKDSTPASENVGVVHNTGPYSGHLLQGQLGQLGQLGGLGGLGGNFGGAALLQGGGNALFDSELNTGVNVDNGLGGGIVL